METSVPLRTQIRQIGIKLALPRCMSGRTFCSFGKARRGDIALHCSPAHAQLTGDSTVPEALVVESHDFLIASDTLVAADLLLAFVIRQAREISLWAGVPLMRC